MNTIVFCFLEKKDTCKGFAFGLFSKPIGHVPLTILYASREQNSIDGGIQALLLRHLFTPLQHNIYASRDQSFIYGRYYLDIACAYCEEALIKSAVLVICHFLFFSGTTTADTTAGVWKAPVRTGTYRYMLTVRRPRVELCLILGLVKSNKSHSLSISKIQYV
jgi:hypothetical protein